MIRFVATWWAKLSYRWQFEVSAAKNMLNSRLAASNAKVKRDFVEQLNAEADEMGATIRKVEAEEDARMHTPEWQKLSPKEQYDDQKQSQDEKTHAAAVMNEKREMAKKEAENVSSGEQTAQYHRGLAESARETAEKLRRL